MKKATQPKPPAWHVTMQYRQRNGFVYELEKADTSIALHISRDDTGPEESWQVTACEGRRDVAAVRESARTRSEALEKVAASWREPTLGLPVLDWDAITSTLRTVRAL
jgi:hypothetical protein